MDYVEELLKTVAPFRYKGRTIRPNMKGNGYVCGGFLFETIREAKNSIDIATHHEPVCKSCGLPLDNNSQIFCHNCAVEEGE